MPSQAGIRHRRGGAKVAPFKVTANGPNCGWLNTLTCRLEAQADSFGEREVGCSEKSNSWSGNAGTALRPKLPEITWLPTVAGVQNAPFAFVAVGARQPTPAAAAAVTVAG